MEKNTRVICPACQYGMLRQEKSLYFTSLGGWPVCARDVPGWYCSFCGYHEFDRRALLRLFSPEWPVRSASNTPIGPQVELEPEDRNPAGEGQHRT